MVVTAQLKNLLTGRALNQSFSGSDKIVEANVTTTQAQFLYKQNNEWHFMEDETFEQYYLGHEQIGEAAQYLTEGVTVTVMKYNDRPVAIEIPKKIALTVVHASPGTRGDTASGGGTKEAELETGIKVQVPLFIEQGERVVVNTDTGMYVERA
jgi:elongation factor P